MKINVSKTAEELGRNAAKLCKKLIDETIAEKGSVRMVFSTGASQFTTFEALLKEDIDWSKVEMFHLDEYMDLPETHIASFRKYLKERFVNIVNPKEAYLVDGEGDVKANIETITEKLKEAPIDVAFIGIGENGHVAFNDPPADFTTDEAYIIVDLDEKCKQQQVNEGWFKDLSEVPKQAVSMTVPQIMKSRVIVSIVPGIRKSDAVSKTLSAEEVTNMVPATILKTHENWNLFLDADSASKIIPQI